MSNQYKDDKPGQTKRATIQLTEEQKKKLSDAFGEEFVKRIAEIQLEEVEGFVKSAVHVN
jgi:hypothetical protein